MSLSGPVGFFRGDASVIARQRAAQVRYFALGVLLLAVIGGMWPILGRGLSRLAFMPHSFCYLGNRTLITTNLVADLLIGCSYVVISLTLLYLVRAKGGIPFHWMFLAFGTFIIACGGTHFMEAITLWHPVYWTSAYVKVITAIASVATAIALPVALPSVRRNIETLRQSEARELQLVKTNQELSAANERLQELDRLRRRFVAQAAANMGDWEWDIRSGRVRWSEEVEAMHGLAPGSFRGTFEEWVGTIHPDDRERATTAVSTAIARNSDYDIEYRTIRPDGSSYWTAARGAIEYGAAGEAIRMVGMCMDITSRKRTEEALRRTEKLAAAGRLAATIAHEINNPLEAVTNLLYLARVDGAAESRKHLLDMADHELQRVSHITRQTLGFYREPGSPVMVEICELLQGVLSIFQGKLNSRRMAVRIDSDQACYVRGVPGELRQIFSNLLSNAIDASPPGAEIRIRVKESSEKVQIAIADHGRGIPEEFRSQVFEPFFTSKKDVGTGLGLWISRQITENHAGSIRFRSSTVVGRSGTVFRVRLPKNAAAQDTAA